MNMIVKLTNMDNQQERELTADSNRYFPIVRTNIQSGTTRSLPLKSLLVNDIIIEHSLEDGYTYWRVESLS